MANVPFSYKDFRRLGALYGSVEESGDMQVSHSNGYSEVAYCREYSLTDFPTLRTKPGTDCTWWEATCVNVEGEEYRIMWDVIDGKVDWSKYEIE